MTSEQDLLLSVKGLKKHFPIRGGIFSTVTGYVFAVDGISFTIEKGETLALVGDRVQRGARLHHARVQKCCAKPSN